MSGVLHSQLSPKAAALPLAPHRLVVGPQEGEGARVLVQVVRIALVLACRTENECKRVYRQCALPWFMPVVKGR